MTKATTPTLVSPSHRGDVFINCPFDPAYTEFHEAIAFTVRFCGYRPRSAGEVVDSGDSRLEKIVQIITECPYGIHDLSRCEFSPKSPLARFNMPFELGLFLGLSLRGPQVQRGKRTLIFDAIPKRYQDTISDLKGRDIEIHENDPEKIVKGVRKWLARKGTPSPTPKEILDALHKFHTVYVKAIGDAGYERHDVPFADMMNYIDEWLTLEFPAPASAIL